MNRFTLITLLLLYAGFLVAQQASILVVDENDDPLDYVALMDTSAKVLAYSEDGQLVFDLDCQQTHYILNYFGYENYVLDLDCKQSHEMKVQLQPEVISLKTINVLGLSAAAQASKPYQVASISKKQLQQFQSQTTVDALESSGGAYIQRSQMGGGSPILRGFEANKVLLVIDGVRMNNAIYRSGHLQNAISVDQAVLENISTLYGPGSILYGSDALGGVVHFQTLRPKFSSTSKTKIDGGYYLRYSSANEEQAGHAHLNIASKKLTSLTSISFASYDDLKAGKNHPDKYPNFGKRLFYVDPETDEIIQNQNPEKQIFSGYDQTDLLQKLTYKFDDNKFLGVNLQYSSSTDIPRYDELTITDEDGIPQISEWYYGPQKRLLTSIRFDSDATSKLFDRYQVLAAYQKINEDRHSRNFLSPNLESNYEIVDVYSTNLDLYKNLSRNKQHQLSYGVEYRYNQVESSAEVLNKETLEITHDIFTRYPSDQSNMYSSGLYALYQMKKEKLTAQLGGRVNYNKLDVKYSRNDFFEWPDYFYEGITQSSVAATWLAGINYQLAEKTHIRLFSGTAFRAPNVDDFAKVRVRTSSSISIPNPDLGPENTWNIELGLQQSIGTALKQHPINLGVTGYYTRIANAIVREDFALPNGDKTYLYNGNELEVQANVNADKGYIVGISLQSKGKFTEHLGFQGSINWQRGRSTTGDETLPLAHIPPVYGQVTFNYRKSKWGVSSKYLFNGKKSIADYAPGSSDNDDLATPEGSLAWNTFHVFADYKFHKLLQLKVGVENIFDLHYRTFSSGISSPGRNFKIGLYGNF